ncbi:MAG: glycosyltransferase family 4 protein [Patescibacteria group bacterium]
MKITFLSYYSGILPRGVEVFVHNLANRLIGLGDEVEVIQSGNALSNSLYRTIRIPMPINNLGQGYILIILNQILDFINGGVFTLKALRHITSKTQIVVPTNNRLQAVIIKLWSFFRKYKILISGHGGPGLDERIALWTFPNVFVALSTPQEDWAKKSNPFIKILKIPNGIDLEEFNPKSKPVMLDLPGPIVLCAAAIWPWMKRQHLLIQAMQHVPNVSLLLVGDGEGRAEIEKLGNKLLPGRFMLKSFAHKDMPGVYTACDLFAYPTSPWESFGIVLLEGMSSGLGSVVTDDPIRREIVGEAGLYVDPTNVRAFAKTISDGLRTDWKDAPRKQASKFSWNVISQKYQELFLQLITK